MLSRFRNGKVPSPGPLRQKGPKAFLFRLASKGKTTKQISKAEIEKNVKRGRLKEIGPGKEYFFSGRTGPGFHAAQRQTPGEFLFPGPIWSIFDEIVVGRIVITQGNAHMVLERYTLQNEGGLFVTLIVQGCSRQHHQGK